MGQKHRGALKKKNHKSRFLRPGRMLSQNLFWGETTLVKCTKSTTNIVMKSSQTFENRNFLKKLRMKNVAAPPNGYQWFLSVFWLWGTIWGTTDDTIESTKS